jgi:hypothetical protein
MQEVETFADLVGCVLSRVTVNSERDEVVFALEDGRSFKLYHEQDCCESVTISDMEGTVEDLIGEVVLAVEDGREATADEASESGTWTFYRIGTIKGTVVLRWLGQSNGYYSESVCFSEVK